ncbi:condensation domain-containing protein [Streptomyces sp. YS-3]|uniref:condensation domain-containing protein n=1 Tax=Streptomyces sp. YS-3 TaxID=3381352 RepID=UPI003862AC7A
MTLSHAQEQMWFLHQMEPSPAYTVPVAYDITGPLDVDVLCAALQTVVDRHEILRTEFVDVDGQPTARVHPPTPLPCPLVELTSGEPELREALKAACAQPLTLDGPHRMSARVYRLTGEHHVLFLMFHHIAVDGMSVQCLLDEVQRYCGSGGTGAPLPPAPQFADHVKAERAADSDPTSDDAHLSYWRTRLAGVDEVTLPADRPRPTGTATHSGRLLRHDLRPGFMAAVEGLAVRERVTPFMVLLAAFAWTLGRTTGSTDIPVGVATSSRASAESFETVGLFVNMLTVRNRIDPALTFRAFLQQTRQNLLADLEHREVPFSQVVRVIRPPPPPRGEPAVQRGHGLRAQKTGPESVAGSGFAAPGRA